MEPVKIRQTVTPEGIVIPASKISRFKGKQVEITISGIDIAESTGTTPKSSLKKSLKSVLEQYRDVKPFKDIEPLEWEREIRDEW